MSWEFDIYPHTPSISTAWCVRFGRKVDNRCSLRSAGRARPTVITDTLVAQWARRFGIVTSPERHLQVRLERDNAADAGFGKPPAACREIGIVACWATHEVDYSYPYTQYDIF